MKHSVDELLGVKIRITDKSSPYYNQEFWTRGFSFSGNDVVASNAVPGEEPPEYLHAFVIDNLEDLEIIDTSYREQLKNSAKIVFGAMSIAASGDES